MIEKLKVFYKDIELVNWGEMPEFDMIINATSVGLNAEDEINLDFSKTNNKFFYDVIYDPHNTKFFNIGNNKGNNFENGLNMFLYQAQKAFNIWHNIEPDIDEETINLLKN